MTMCEVKANVDVVVKALIRDADPVGESLLFELQMNRSNVFVIYSLVWQKRNTISILNVSKLFKAFVFRDLGLQLAVALLHSPAHSNSRESGFFKETRIQCLKAALDILPKGKFRVQGYFLLLKH